MSKCQVNLKDNEVYILPMEAIVLLKGKALRGSNASTLITEHIWVKLRQPCPYISMLMGKNKAMYRVASGKDSDEGHFNVLYPFPQPIEEGDEYAILKIEGAEMEEEDKEIQRMQRLKERHTGWQETIIKLAEIAEMIISGRKAEKINRGGLNNAKNTQR